MTAKFSTERVIEACEFTIKKLIKAKFERLEHLLVEEMNKKRYFYGRNFTREEALNRLQNKSGLLFSAWDITSLIDSDRLNKVTDLLNACRHVNDNIVNLNTYEIQLLDWPE